ncbi:DUF1648 domain-containing protein [Chloroflexota bacterium]
MKKTSDGTAFTFHWSYIGLPVAVLLLSVILAVFFYPRLPDEIAYRFLTDGLPYKWGGRGSVVFWMLLLQVLLSLVAGAITWGVNLLAARYIEPEGTVIKPQRIILLMGNMITLIQIILGFAMLDIFSYNLFQVHLLPLWLFALIVLIVGGIIMGIFFLRTVWQSWIASKE